jgi:hypothetical protein
VAHTVVDRAVSAGDPLDRTLAGAVRRRAMQAVVQRVGETKLAYEPAASAALPEARDLWLEALQELRDARKLRKSDWEAFLKQQANTEEGISQKAIMTNYPKDLRLDSNVIAALKRTAPFQGRNGLRLDTSTAEDGSEQHVVKDQYGEPVAVLLLGADAYTDSGKSPGGRATFRRNGKEYVADDRGVPTRRYAYVEKNVFQLMDFITQASMTGRYQMFHAALNIQSDIYAAGEQLGRDVTGRNDFRVGDKLTLEQLAVLHQWKGSGQEQRGLSLTSTPREEAVYSNRGGSFRSAGGARMQIDLFRIPANVVLINHYGKGGVKEELGGVSQKLDTGSTYSYTSSVIKNRELFLEKLEFGWVSAVTVHGETGDQTKRDSDGDLRQLLSQRLGYGQYTAGFTLGAQGQAAASEVPMHLLGHGVGAEYRAGWIAGGRAFPLAQPPPERNVPRTPGNRHQRRPPPWTPPPHRGPNWGALKIAAHDAQDDYERGRGPERHMIYWIGWAHGGWHRPLAKTLTGALGKAV